MFGGELFTEDMEEEFGKSLYIPHRELTLQCDLEIEDGGKEDDDDKKNEACIYTAVAGASHVLIAKGTKIFSYGENFLGQCGHNHVSELNRPTAIVSCVIPEDTTDFHNTDQAYRLDVGKIFSGIH